MVVPVLERRHRNRLWQGLPRIASRRLARNGKPKLRRRESVGTVRPGNWDRMHCFCHHMCFVSRHVQRVKCARRHNRSY